MKIHLTEKKRSCAFDLKVSNLIFIQNTPEEGNYAKTYPVQLYETKLEEIGTALGEKMIYFRNRGTDSPKAPMLPF